MIRGARREVCAAAGRVQNMKRATPVVAARQFFFGGAARLPFLGFVRFLEIGLGSFVLICFFVVVVFAFLGLVSFQFFSVVQSWCKFKAGASVKFKFKAGAL